jgi:hypothetical protein
MILSGFFGRRWGPFARLGVVFCWTEAGDLAGKAGFETVVGKMMAPRPVTVVGAIRFADSP